MSYIRRHAAIKNILSIVLLLLVFTAIVCVIGFNSFTEAMMDQYADGGYLIARAAAEIVDADRMDEYLASGGESEEYKETWKRLDQLCNSSGSTFIYVIQPDRTDFAHITFVFSTINHKSSYSVFDFGYVRETTNEEYMTKYRALYSHASERELVIRDKGYIETDPHITVMVGLHDARGQVNGILCVQRQMDVLARMRNTYLAKVAAALLILSVLTIVVQTTYLHHVLLKPLQQIADEAVRFASENVTRGVKLKDVIHNQDEIGQLAESIDRMEEQIEDYVGNITRITAEKERIETELELAKRIQRDMLPSVFPPFPEKEEFDLYATMTPARAVGGDFYDFFMIDDDHLCVLIADVSGKGVPAALFMMSSKIILANNAMSGKTPAQILTDSNAAICANNQEEMFVSVWLGILEISTGKLTSANAGHEYPAIKTPNGQFQILKQKHSLVVGALDGVKYRDYEIQMEPGSKLFVYTDGVPEATDADDTMYALDRMIAALNSAADRKPKEILDAVREDIDSFVKDAEQFDDLTMLCLELKSRGPAEERQTREKE